MEDNHDGSYTCSYAPLLAGFYSVEIRCGDEIDGSPFSMWAKAENQLLINPGPV